MPGVINDIDDVQLQALVQRLRDLANIESLVRGAMVVDAKARRDTLVNDALRKLANAQRDTDVIADTERRVLVERAVGYLRGYLRGISRSRNLGAALESLVGARRLSRARVDARAAELGTAVPPLCIVPAPEVGRA